MGQIEPIRMEKGQRLQQNIELGLQQRLTARQIQLIRLLQTPMLELDEVVKQELERNPALEEGPLPEGQNGQGDEQTADHQDQVNPIEDNEEYTASDYASEDDEPADAYPAQSHEEAEREGAQLVQASTNREALIEQLRFLHLQPRILMLAEYIVGNLDDDGYLRREMEALSDDLFIDSNLATDMAELEEALRTVQSLEPRGVGARNLQECLLLQIREHTDRVSLIATQILAEQYEAFANRQFERIMERLALDEDDLRAAIDRITTLTPRPADLRGNDAQAGAQTIVPDFLLHVDQDTGAFGIVLNDRNLPLLHVSPEYQAMLAMYRREPKQHHEREAARFVRAKVEEAHQFIDALDQRNRTLLRVMDAIVKLQQEYFIDGQLQKLRPMILKEVAEVTGFDISTISRIVNSKHVQTPYGIRALRDFFSEGSTTSDGDTVSTRAIKERLRAMIANEDKRSPFSDEQLVQLLANEGYTVARRTVAKYREQLGLPIARLRRKV